MDQPRIEIKAEGRNCQSAYTINNYSSLKHLKNLSDWVMIGSGMILILSIIGLAIIGSDFWATMLFIVIYGLGVVIFFISLSIYLYLEYFAKDIR